MYFYFENKLGVTWDLQNRGLVLSTKMLILAKDSKFKICIFEIVQNKARICPFFLRFMQQTPRIPMHSGRVI